MTNNYLKCTRLAYFYFFLLYNVKKLFIRNTNDSSFCKENDYKIQHTAL